MKRGLVSAWAQARSAGRLIEELASQLEVASPQAIVFFAAPTLDGRALSAGLRGCFPDARVVGCTTAGEFTQRVQGEGAVAALGLGAPVVLRAAAALARFEEGVTPGVMRALGALGERLGTRPPECDPRRHAGVVLFGGLHGEEEEANAALRSGAPRLRFVGGSAGDNLAFQRTRVFVDREECDRGAALLLLECEAPFTVVSACSFEPVGPPLAVTRADPSRRALLSLDGRPAAEVYARVLGCRLDSLGNEHLQSHPLGLRRDGTTVLRSPRRLGSDGALELYGRLEEGGQVHVMRPAPLLVDTARALAHAAGTLGRPARGGLVFHSVLRRLDLDARGASRALLDTFGGAQVAGFHGYGESDRGHLNHTLTALLFG